MSEEPDVFRCHVVAENAEALKEFLHETQADVGCRAIARGTRAGVGLDLYFRQDQLDQARAARSAPLVNITEVENVTENWRNRKEEVGGGDRFADRDVVPHGLGRKE
ncbi:hypothetical protein [Streptomyces lomondensis]|uniref:Uncharacterized protein n=1 Tax=Streptomyces lomondensis TaxID=68229 RepID=A0ABQ2XWR4_9ACTN|nr:hypothetical protein [Streptomyces lomondensis]MCF0082775.1 hypothetical protein [Streptomyces lomondensis]GGX36506.1 hypothetical protein GCM10010383_78280 [Streptomyces lomondensis]